MRRSAAILRGYRLRSTRADQSVTRTLERLAGPRLAADHVAELDRSERDHGQEPGDDSLDAPRIEAGLAQGGGVSPRVAHVHDQHASAGPEDPRDLAHGGLPLAGIVDVVQRHAREDDVEARVVER